MFGWHAILNKLTSVQRKAKLAMSLDKLRREYSWPEEVPPLPENLNEGFFTKHHAQAIQQLLDGDDNRVILELGSWLGKSTRWFCRQFPGSVVIALDHWRKPTEPLYPFPDLRDMFLRNCWQFRDQIIPMRERTVIGMHKLAVMEIEPDLIYVDASNDRKSVYNDILVASQWPRATIIGDDWTHKPVEDAVRCFLSRGDQQGCGVIRKNKVWKLLRSSR